MKQTKPNLLKTAKQFKENAITLRHQQHQKQKRTQTNEHHFFSNLVTAVGKKLSTVEKFGKTIINLNKPKAYQLIDAICTDINSALDANALLSHIPTEVKEAALRLERGLEHLLCQYDNGSINEKELIQQSHDLVYYETPSIAAAPDFLNQIAATLNAFTQWLGGFNIVPEDWITKTQFFNPITRLTKELKQERHHSPSNHDAGL